MTSVSRLLSLVAAALTLAACTPRAELALVAAPDPVQTERIYVATARVPIDPPLDFSASRADRLSFAAYDIGIPPNRAAGDVRYPGARPDPNRQFTVTSAHRLADETALADALAQGPTDHVVIFVHGYNYTLGEAVYRHAQIAHDFDMQAPQITFAWASAARPLGYIHDRDSIAIARDDFEALLGTLLREQDKDILLVGHSMGAMLIMETLRQMAVANRRINHRIEGVMLISPDIDITLFLNQVERIAPLPKPFVVITSQDDRVLRLSARLSGRPQRLGSLSDTERLRSLDITVVDLTELRGGDPRGHMTAVTSPDAIALLRGFRRNDMFLADRNPRGLDLLGPLAPSIRTE
ncbi:alpha/beta hydrolase [Marivita hallyeonensis]|uniref:Esterase/lipase superfamily enzyme n=1 Tax=Marivita hallyeonensis TaxID=996342 RepID=A0A1M5S5R8_9RHOB|nr:alpha/beta fold hydrolase [Marivita hallyeonensis]SHH33947.1 Esterase/lipase superfamily enzyme [Marivita hallyeonensis]